METMANETHPNSTKGTNVKTKEKMVVLPTTVGLNEMEEDVVVNEKSITDIESVEGDNKPTQKQIENIAKDSLFDGNGYTKTNPNGEVKEYETDTTVEVLVDDTMIDNLLPIEKVNQSKDLSALTTNEKALRDTLLEDLEKAQFYTVVALYYITM